MATPSAIAKRTEKRQIEILEAVKMLMAEVAELKAETGRTDVIELKAELDETIDRTDEILAAIHSIVKTEIYSLKQQVAEVSSQIAELKEQTGLVSIAIGSMADEMVNIKAEVAQPPASRRTKK